MMKFALLLLIALLSQALSFMPVKSVPQARFSLFLKAKANNGINVNSEMIRKVMLQNLLLSGSVISTALLLNAGIVHAQTNVFDDNLEHSIEKREKIGGIKQQEDLFKREKIGGIKQQEDLFKREKIGGIKQQEFLEKREKLGGIKFSK